MHYQDLFLENTDSTNRVARELADRGAVHGSGVLAKHQTAGRGRLGRPWFSPAGTNLYCSYVVRPQISIADFPKLTMVAGVAGADYLHQYVGDSVQLKWPNDLYVNGRKCGGILSESFSSKNPPHVHFAVLGIGINLNINTDELPVILQDSATSLAIEGIGPIQPVTAFHALRKQLLLRIRDFEQTGFQAILQRWRGYDMLHGKKMEWVTADGRLVCGESLGPDDNGLLRVKDERGDVHQVISGDVCLATK